MGQGKLSCGKPNFSSILSATDETLPRSRFKRGAKEIFDESFKIFSLLSPGSANVSQKLFPCLLPHISQRKQQAAQITTVKGEMSALRFFLLFNPLSICFFEENYLFIWLWQMHEVGIINWILVRLSCWVVLRIVLCFKFLTAEPPITQWEFSFREFQ